jgi:hypothetical protein
MARYCLRRHGRGSDRERHRWVRVRDRSHRHPREQRRHAVAHAAYRDLPGELALRDRYRSDKRVPCRADRRTPDDPAGARQDHQRLFGSVRARAARHRRLHRRQGRSPQPHAGHGGRMEPRGSPGKRPRARLHPDGDDPAARRGPRVRHVGAEPDTSAPMGPSGRPGRTGRVARLARLRFRHRAGHLRRRRHDIGRLTAASGSVPAHWGRRGRSPGRSFASRGRSRCCRSRCPAGTNLPPGR